ncbi:MAG: hypothetical protein J5I92_16995 [Thiogranum sp.]|nr:hypothetical protein [Thiogranum sp.]
MSLSRIQERLLTSVRKNNETGCWEWAGQISNSGYGRLKIRDENGDVRMQSAEHVSYEAFIGPVPRDMLIRQSCRNRLCVNPQHLEIFDPARKQQA